MARREDGCHGEYDREPVKSSGAHRAVVADLGEGLNRSSEIVSANTGHGRSVRRDGQRRCCSNFCVFAAYEQMMHVSADACM